jgi:hypothetical protein
MSRRPDKSPEPPCRPTKAAERRRMPSRHCATAALDFPSFLCVLAPLRLCVE